MRQLVGDDSLRTGDSSGKGEKALNLPNVQTGLASTNEAKVTYMSFRRIEAYLSQFHRNLLR